MNPKLKQWISQHRRQLWEKLNVSPWVVFNWWQGRSAIPETVARHISQETGIPTAEFGCPIRSPGRDIYDGKPVLDVRIYTDWERARHVELEKRLAELPPGPDRWTTLEEEFGFSRSAIWWLCGGEK